MSDTFVSLRTYPAPPIDQREIFRYMGGRGDADEITQGLIASVTEEAMPHLSYRVCWLEAPVTYLSHGVTIGAVTCPGQSLVRHLQGSTRALVFAATIGLEIDRMVAKYSRHEPGRALALQALGAERVEALCESFLREQKKEYAPKGIALLSRFSPGYGDLPLDVQTSLFQVLDCPRKIGLSLRDSLLMTPTKSVTAIVGLTASESARMT